MWSEVGESQLDSEVVFGTALTFSCVDSVDGFGPADLMVEGVELCQVVAVSVFPGGAGHHQRLETLELGFQFGELLGVANDVGFEADDPSFEFFAFGPVGASADRAAPRLRLPALFASARGDVLALDALFAARKQVREDKDWQRTRRIGKRIGRPRAPRAYAAAK